MNCTRSVYIHNFPYVAAKFNALSRWEYNMKKVCKKQRITRARVTPQIYGMLVITLLFLDKWHTQWDGLTQPLF